MHKKTTKHGNGSPFFHIELIQSKKKSEKKNWCPSEGEKCVVQSDTTKMVLENVCKCVWSN